MVPSSASPVSSTRSTAPARGRTSQLPGREPALLPLADAAPRSRTSKPWSTGRRARSRIATVGDGTPRREARGAARDRDRAVPARRSPPGPPASADCSAVSRSAMQAHDGDRPAAAARLVSGSLSQRDARAGRAEARPRPQPGGACGSDYRGCRASEDQHREIVGQPGVARVGLDAPPGSIGPAPRASARDSVDEHAAGRLRRTPRPAAFSASVMPSL